MGSPRFFAMICTAIALLCLPGLAASAGTREKNLVLYTALTATTPQIPLWAAINAGWPGNGNVSVEYWKTLDDLRATMLAGKGDIWVGHLEGFAQAALRGAPVRLVAVTGWKKFSFVAPGTSPANGAQTLAATLRDANIPLAVAPRDSPALAILETMKRSGGPSFTVAAMQPQQLMLEMLRGGRQYALLPEPFVSLLLAKLPNFRVMAGLEEEFSRLRGGPARLPLVGVAVNAAFADREPEKIRELAAAMRRHADRLAGNADEAIAALPEAVRKNLGDEIIRASLPRDLLLAVPAAEIREEIAAFLRLVLPQTDPVRLDALLDGPFLAGE